MKVRARNWIAPLAGLMLLGGLSGIVPAQTTSHLMFSVDSVETGIFPVLDEGGDLVHYDITTGDLLFGVATGSAGNYDNPLICFDFSDPADSSAGISLTDPNGHVVGVYLGLTSSLNYFIDTDELALSPSSSTQCFYRGTPDDETTFGLYGQPPAGTGDSQGADDGSLFGDKFAAYPEISVEYIDIAELGLVPAGNTVEYGIVVSNTGIVEATELALQEVFPNDAEVYPDSLTAGSWLCDPSVEVPGVCPEDNDQNGPIRLTTLLDGIELPAHSSVIFTVTRAIRDSATSGSEIPLHVAVVNGAGSSAPYDVASAVITVE